MDKVYIALDVVKRYNFWFLAGGALLIALLCWSLASAELSTRFEKRKGELDGLVGQVRQVIGDTTVPNATKIENIKEEHRKLREHVFEAWDLLYQQQKKNNPVPEVLGEDFRMYFEALRPGEEMRDRFRERYRDFIKKHYLELLRLVDRRHVEGEEDPRLSRAGSGEGRPRGGRGYEDAYAARPPRRRERETGTQEEDAKMVGTVIWDSPEIFDIADWNQRPTTQQVMLAQEDLWVYEALLRMIRNVNEGVESHDKAWIKRITALEIGRPAAEAWVGSQTPIFTPPASPTETERSGAAGAAVGGAVAMEPGMDRMGYEDTRPMDTAGGSLLDGRYVDESGYPLTAQQHLTQPPYAEFKMMMVRMDLYLHQRHLADLMVECANSPMPVEVARVRLNPNEGSGGELDGSSNVGRGNSERRRSGPRIVRSGEGGESALDEERDYIDVELFGIIYIYNRPDREKLGSGAAGAEAPDEAPAETAPDGTTPGAEPPATQPPGMQPAAPTAPPGGETPGPADTPEPEPGAASPPPVPASPDGAAGAPTAPGGTSP